MPFLGDLQFYQQIAAHEGGTIRQQGRTLVDAYFDGPGPSGLTNGADRGCLVLDGTDKPIRINGPVVVAGDVIIKGKVTGQGTIYSGRNIHIIGNLTYVDPPSWPKPDPHPEQTAQKNAGKDMLGLAAKGNIVIGNYTDSSWMERVEKYITPPWVREYACDPSDASIGYPSVFGGDYAANDGGRQIHYVRNPRTGMYEPTATSARTYTIKALWATESFNKTPKAPTSRRLMRYCTTITLRWAESGNASLTAPWSAATRPSFTFALCSSTGISGWALTAVTL